MDQSVSTETQQQQQPVDWLLLLHRFKTIIATTNNTNQHLQIQSLIKLAHLSNRAPPNILVSTVPILVHLLDTSSSNDTILKATAYCLKHISCQPDGKLVETIGQSPAVNRILILLPQSEVYLQRVLLKCLRNIVAFDRSNRVIVARTGGLKIVIDMLNSGSCSGIIRPLLLDVLSALALLREVRRSVYNLRAVRLLVEACESGKMASRVRAAQAIGLLGLVKRARRELANAGAIRVLVGLLRDGDVAGKIVAGNALGVISAHVDYIRPAVEHGVIPLYAQLLREHEPLCKEIAEDVFCVFAVIDDNAVAIVEHLVGILRGGDDESVAAAADVVWDLSSYKHVLPVFHRFGVVSLLVDVLRTSDDNNVKEKVCGAIGQLSYNEAERVAIADVAGVSVLIGLLEDESDDDDDVKDSAAQALVCFSEDPMLCDRVSGVVSHPVFVRVRDRMVQTRAAESRVAESVRQMTIDELTWSPALG